MTLETIVSANQAAGGAQAAASADGAAAAATNGNGAAANGAANGANAGAADGGDKGAASGNGAVVDNGFPANWRDTFGEQIAPGDAAFRKRLDRFTAPYDVGKSWRALEQRQSSGELKSQLPKEATPEQTAQWRKDNGIPEKPEGYLEKLTLPDGMVLGADDKPIVTEFAAAAHEHNISPAALSGLVSQYYKIQDAQALRQQEADGKFKQESDDGLRNEWGADYRANINAVGNLLARMPAGFDAHFLGARILAPTKEDPGRTVSLGNHPAFIKWAASMEREINPVATLLPSRGGDPAQGVNDRLAEIRKVRSENPDAYDQDKKLQAEELKLLEARDKMAARGQKAA